MSGEYDQECFYQRHANDMLDESVLRYAQGKGRGRDYIAVDSLKGVIALVQAGVLGCTPGAAAGPSRSSRSHNFRSRSDPELLGRGGRCGAAATRAPGGF